MSAENRVLMIFLDGVGIGKPDPSCNPFFKFGFRTFSEQFHQLPSLEKPYLEGKDCRLFPVDAVMGVEGLPQSGTGQASIFCGINAQKLCGMHFGPFPHSSIVPAVKELNIFKRLKDAGQFGFFANAYPRVFFDYLRSGKDRLSVTTLAYRSTGHRLNSSTDVYRRRALTAEITNARWNQKLDYHLPLLTPSGAALRLIRIAMNHHFTLYEYFFTDYIGHKRLPDEDGKLHGILDEFLCTILMKRPANLTVCFASDHGNYEDTADKKHTTNPALGLLAGPLSEEFSSRIENLSHITPVLLDIIQQK
jgi:hypothetical protein